MTRAAAVALAGVLACGVLAGCGRDEVRLTVSQGDADRAPELFHDYGCTSCHQIPGIRRAVGRVGPSLDGFGDRGYVAGELPNGPEELTRWIRSPQDVEPGTAMPDVGVTEQDARDMAAYLLERT